MSEDIYMHFIHSHPHTYTHTHCSHTSRDHINLIEHGSPPTTTTHRELSSRYRVYITQALRRSSARVLQWFMRKSREKSKSKWWKVYKRVCVCVCKVFVPHDWLWYNCPCNISDYYFIIHTSHVFFTSSERY